MKRQLVNVIEELVKAEVEKDGFVFDELFFDNGTIHAHTTESTDRVELELFDFLAKIKIEVK